MSAAKLDQIVKGAPMPNATLPKSGRSPSPTPSISTIGDTTPPADHDLPDPTSILPSSPPQIYLNLLILEASLRSQYLTLRDRRRQHTFFLLLLTAWIAFFFYALFMRPREDGKGLGGSVYWVVEMAEKVALMGGVVTALLVWGTGQWERGIRWPRRWLGIANRGLRNTNTKLVVIKGPWWKELFSTLGLLFPYGSLFPSSDSSYHYVEHSTTSTSHGRSEKRYGTIEEDAPSVEEDLSPGGDYVKLLLLPKPFSPGFRENWELYRTEYWEKENERRAVLRQRLQQRRREIAKKEGGWLWWTGWRGWKRAKGGDIEKTHGHHPHGHRRQHSDAKHRQRESGRTGSHSRGSSRSSTPILDGEDRPLLDRTRRGSSASSAADRRRNPRGLTAMSSIRSMKSQPGSSRASTPGAPDQHPPLLRQPSFQSMSSGNESDRSEMSSRDPAQEWVNEAGRPTRASSRRVNTASTARAR